MKNQEIIKIIKDFLEECLNAKENNGVCNLTWRHDSCLVLMQILFLVTGEEKYNTVINRNLTNLWD